MVKAVEGAMNDLRSFICEKVDQLEEEMREPILSDLKHTKELCLSELLVANSYISELKALHEEEKHASSLPSGIIPPTYNGDPLLFPMTHVAETAPYAIDTMFGWVLAGPFHIQRLKAKESRKCMALTATDASPWSKLEKLLEGFWNMESIGLVEKNDVYTKEERDAVRSFERSISFSNNRYVVALPFKKNSPELLSNYSQARTRLISCEKSLKRDELKRAAYKTAIEDMLSVGLRRQTKVLCSSSSCF